VKPEKQNLIRDLLNDQGQEARRQATLLAGSRLLRHKRWRRLARRSLLTMCLLASLTLAIYTVVPRKQVVLTTAPRPSIRVHYLSDDELLALFPDTPVGLATVGSKKRLIFPRPGDEARFVTRL